MDNEAVALEKVARAFPPRGSDVDRQKGEKKTERPAHPRAAREVLLADPHTPMSAVATRASVGMSALYRRYRSKDALLGQLCFDGLLQYVAAAETALADEGEPWSVYVTFMKRIVDADTHANVLRLAGTFRPTKSFIARPSVHTAST
jgi:AcrR family transcriptional regulator